MLHIAGCGAVYFAAEVLRVHSVTFLSMGRKCASKMYVQNYTAYHLEDPNHDFSVR